MTRKRRRVEKIGRDTHLRAAHTIMQARKTESGPRIEEKGEPCFVTAAGAGIGRQPRLGQPNTCPRRQRAPSASLEQQVPQLLTSALEIDQITFPMVLVGIGSASALVALVARRKPELCDMCGGMGGWSCVICDSEGVLIEGRSRKKCEACVGRGKRLCRKCSGTGYLNNYFG